MTEEKILELLLPKHYDYPKLESNAAETIAKSLTDIIYDTLTPKSTNKRLNVLKLIKTFASHVDETNYTTFIDALEGQFDDTSDDFLNKVKSDLKGQLPKNLCEEVLQFYQRRNQKREERIKRLELIKKYDQETLNNDNFLYRVTRSITHYETSENLVKQLLNNEQEDQNCHKLVDFNSLDYRGKQVQFAYGLLYLKRWGTLRKVLQRLKTYETLTDFEKTFLSYLNENGECLREILVKDFIFLYENIVLSLCTRIIQLHDAQIPQFFATLLCDKQYLILKSLCSNNKFRLKLKNLLFELYGFSFCNVNLLKFIDLFE
ncbi:uncharacterized protein LOC123008836 [Tribolium madens]|uniref:uncharacterized protein LOC123008836 n=1 Tax=Tribolium madens TaxID=41895 RepID=UPI001CF741D8|nr:uncharacterized protein LOC123008836 [Tribolium madens]